MSNDVIIVIAMLNQLKLISAKEAQTLYEELKYKNIPTTLDDATALIESAFKAARIGEKPAASEIVVGGKTIKLTK